MFILPVAVTDLGGGGGHFLDFDVSPKGAQNALISLIFFSFFLGADPQPPSGGGFWQPLRTFPAHHLLRCYLV